MRPCYEDDDFAILLAAGADTSSTGALTSAVDSGSWRTSKSRSNGWFQLKRLTSAKQMRARLKAIREVLMRRMHEPIPMAGRWLRRVVQGC